jgi:hypothetical protein
MNRTWRYTAITGLLLPITFLVIALLFHSFLSPSMASACRETPLTMAERTFPDAR